MQNKLYKRLQELREGKGLSRNQLKALLKDRGHAVGGSTIERWETGKSIPSAEYVYILCKFFGCKSDYLLGLDD